MLVPGGLVTEYKKWFEVDFNDPRRIAVIAKDEATWRLARHMEHPRRLPVVGEEVFIYTFDDSEPFAFRAHATGLDEGENCWVASFKEDGPYYHWRTDPSLFWSDPEQVAKLFHDTYEYLAPHFGYVTREESAKSWDSVPKKNRDLMIAVVTAIGRKAMGEEE